jgi:hypothetical protein
MEKRKLERIELPRTILVRSGTLGYADSAAVLKNISAAGAYYLTLMALAQGEVVELFVTLHDAEGTHNLSSQAQLYESKRASLTILSGLQSSFPGSGNLTATVVVHKHYQPTPHFFIGEMMFLL